MAEGELRFDGRVAVVTGAGRGIGREHALLLAARGAAVVVNDFGGGPTGGDASGDTEPADSVVEAIRAAGGSAVANYASVTDEHGAQSIVADAMNAFGRLDVVINNAGILALAGWFDEQPIDVYRRLMDVHYFGTLHVCRAAWPIMCEARYGRIVNTSSTTFLGFMQSAPYNGAKAAVLGLTMTLAAEGRRFGIQTNCFNPTGDTRMPAAFLGSGADEYAHNILSAAETGTAEHPRLAAPGAVYLAHESCSLNGEFVRSGGGWIASGYFAMTEGLVDHELALEVVRDNIELIMDESTATRHRIWE